MCKIGVDSKPYIREAKWVKRGRKETIFELILEGGKKQKKIRGCDGFGFIFPPQ